MSKKMRYSASELAYKLACSKVLHKGAMLSKYNKKKIEDLVVVYFDDLINLVFEGALQGCINPAQGVYLRNGRIITEYQQKMFSKLESVKLISKIRSFKIEIVNVGDNRTIRLNGFQVTEFEIQPTGSFGIVFDMREHYFEKTSCE